MPSGAKPIVVDYCAGAGGKTLAIAAATRQSRSDRRERHRRRQARGAAAPRPPRARLEHASGRRSLELDELRGKADVVLVDAPCSGVGALRRNPEARWRLREDELAGFAARQREILAAAGRLVAPGGRIVYATCSLLACENADVVARRPGSSRCRSPTCSTRRAPPCAREKVHSPPRHIGTVPTVSSQPCSGIADAPPGAWSRFDPTPRREVATPGVAIGNASARDTFAKRMAIEVSVVRDLAAFRALEADWRTLAAGVLFRGPGLADPVVARVSQHARRRAPRAGRSRDRERSDRHAAPATSCASRRCIAAPSRSHCSTRASCA